MAVATDREYGLYIGGELAEPAFGEIRAVEAARGAVDGETRSLIVSTGARPINPFGL